MLAPRDSAAVCVLKGFCPAASQIWLTVLVISRDVIIVVTVAIVNLSTGRRTFKPTLLGKLATLVYLLTAAVTMYFNWLGRPSALVDVAIYATLGVTLVSGLHYIAHASRVLNDV